MKKIENVIVEINEILSNFPNGCIEKGADERRIEKHLLFLKSCKLYLENNPSEGFIKEQLDLVEKKISYLDRGFDAWKVDNPDSIKKNPKTAYYTECGMKALKLQLKTLKYLIDS